MLIARTPKEGRFLNSYYYQCLVLNYYTDDQSIYICYPHSDSKIILRKPNHLHINNILSEMYLETQYSNMNHKDIWRSGTDGHNYKRLFLDETPKKFLVTEGGKNCSNLQRSPFSRSSSPHHSIQPQMGDIDVRRFCPLSILYCPVSC